MIFFGDRKKTEDKERSRLRNELARLQIRLKESEVQAKELDKIAKTLVRRDMELSETRRKQEEQVIELDKIAKTLVRRDMELMRLNDELVEIDRSKAQFVSIAAHQLRTPLSIIKWTFRMLLSEDFGPLNSEQKQVVERGYSVNEGMVKLISDLLDVARIETGKFSYKFERINITDVITKALVALRKLSDERKIGITASGEGVEKLYVLADRIALETALENLISNAIVYTLPGGKVDILYKEIDDFLEVRVKDSGVGIPAREMSRLFTKFFRSNNALKLQTSGSGLGLFIAKNIIAAHGGTIGVESEEGKGSTFWFRLPLK